MTYLAPLPTPALARLDELAARWLYQYLPRQLQAHRHAQLADLRSALAAAREREDAAQGDVETLRQRQLALALRPAATAPATPVETPQPAPPPTPVVMTPVAPKASEPIRQQLETLRLELSRLRASFTEEHPQVIALRSQIEQLQQQVQTEQRPTPRPSVGPELIPAPADRQADSGSSIRPASAGSFVSTRTAELATDRPPDEVAGDLAAAVTAALARIAHASRDRQAAEHRLSDRMQELSSQPSAEWSAEPAHVVTRLGGTPRCATLALGGLLAAIGGIVVFRGSAALVLPPKIETAAELASALEIPVVGSTAALRKAAARIKRPIFTAGRVRVVVHLAEAIVAAAVVACLLSIAVEPPLARQVLTDPFGTLSEVVGRFG